jgi:hypothetical protein
MYPFFISSQTTGHILIYLYYNHLGPIANRPAMRTLGAKIEKTMFIHRSNLQHSYVQSFNMLPNIARQF